MNRRTFISTVCALGAATVVPLPAPYMRKVALIGPTWKFLTPERHKLPYWDHAPWTKPRNWEFKHTPKCAPGHTLCK